MKIWIPVWEKNMHTKPSPLILMLVVVTFLAASILPEAGVSAQGEAGGGECPHPAPTTKHDRIENPHLCLDESRWRD